MVSCTCRGAGLGAPLVLDRLLSPDRLTRRAEEFSPAEAHPEGNSARRTC